MAARLYKIDMNYEHFWLQIDFIMSTVYGGYKMQKLK